MPASLDCDALDCRAVLPGAVRFEHDPAGKPYAVGYTADGTMQGWVALSTDVVDIKAYSGKPLVTLVGITRDGHIGGVHVIHHSEPILLVGIPESQLHAFVARYAGKPLGARIAVGASPDPGVITVDGISGATVTVLAQNRTILDTARRVGEAVKVLKASARAKGELVKLAAPWTWAEMVAHGVFGRLVVSEAEMGAGSSGDPFVDLTFTIADAPQVGMGLLGAHEYEWMTKELKPGEHLLVVLGNGSSSFKGSGFVRGGVFDRIRLEQDLRTLVFTDRDYHPLSRPAAADAPFFKEGAAFVTRDDALDLGRPFDLVFLGSHYNHRGGFGRDFKTFRATQRLPESVYHVEQEAWPSSVVRDALYTARYRVLTLLAVLLVIAGLFFGRRFLTGSMLRLQRLHLGVLLLAFGVLGLGLRAQPSVTQVLTAIGGIVGEWRWELFLSDPIVFVGWVFIALVAVTWGRGVFCGWACPYGAMTELLYKLGRKLKLPELELPDPIHRRLRFLRYVVLAVLIAVFVKDSTLGEKMAEVEPFKSTFFVAPWTRAVPLFVWWLGLAAWSLFVFRPFCRYLCPLGAALAIPGSLRFSGPRRRNFCSDCKICTRGCEPKAIRDDGTIDPRECLSCMECEANFRDRQVCPPLIGLDRLTRDLAGREPSAAEVEKRRKLEEGARRC